MIRVYNVYYDKSKLCGDTCLYRSQCIINEVQTKFKQPPSHEAVRVSSLLPPYFL